MLLRLAVAGQVHNETGACCRLWLGGVLLLDCKRQWLLLLLLLFCQFWQRSWWRFCLYCRPWLLRLLHQELRLLFCCLCICCPSPSCCRSCWAKGFLLLSCSLRRLLGSPVLLLLLF